MLCAQNHLATWNLPVGRWPVLPSCSREGLRESTLPKMDRDADDKRMKSQAPPAACAACGCALAWAERASQGKQRSRRAQALRDSRVCLASLALAWLVSGSMGFPQ